MLLAGAEKGRGKRRELDRESLLRIPLVARMLADPTVQLCARGVDQNWVYQQGIPHSVVGFSPFRGEVYFGGVSCFADWLRAPHASARETNVNDELVREALFAVHDYLHVWAYRLIQELEPGLGFGSAPIHRGNWEKFVFCHLLTETAATVGLDYWYLCTVDLNEVLPIGTRLRALTVDYHERDLGEFQRFHPGFQPQRPEFFREVAEFYCSGELTGFSAADMRRSPKLTAWLKHELIYGAKQREYARAWFRCLSADPQLAGEPCSDAPLACGGKWQQHLIHEVGARLWELVKEGKAHRFSSRRPEPWEAPEKKQLDFRFLNLNAWDEEEAFARAAPESFAPLCHQWLARHDFSTFDCDLAPALPDLLRERNGKAFRAALKGMRALPRFAGEPREVFVMP